MQSIFSGAMCASTEQYDANTSPYYPGQNLILTRPSLPYSRRRCSFQEQRCWTPWPPTHPQTHTHSFCCSATLLCLPPQSNSLSTFGSELTPSHTCTSTHTRTHAHTHTHTHRHTHRVIISWNNTNRCMHCCEQTVCASAANRVGGRMRAKSPLPRASSIPLLSSSSH